MSPKGNIFLFSSWLFIFDLAAVLGRSAPQTNGSIQNKSLEYQPQLTSFHVRAFIWHRYVTTRITARFTNHNKTDSPVDFSFRVPENAFITNLTMTIDSESFIGEIRDKRMMTPSRKNRRRDRGINRPNALRQRRKFRLAETIPAGSDAKIDLTFESLLHRKQGYYEYALDLVPGQASADFQLDINLMESRPIAFVKAWPFKHNSSAQDEGIEVSSTSPEGAHISFQPTIDQQLSFTPEGIKGKLVVHYDIERKLDAGEIKVSNSHLVHFFSPSDLPRLQRVVVFILDNSGSMEGEKWHNTRQVITHQISRLEDADLFNVVVFTSHVACWQNDGVHQASPGNKESAKQWMSNLTTGGAANINDAIIKGLDLISRGLPADRETRSSQIIFLADGEPTTGVTNVENILDNVREANNRKVAIHSIAYGKSADERFLNRLALQNGGNMLKVQGGDLAIHKIERFLRQFSSPRLSNVQFDYSDDAIETGSIVQRGCCTLYNSSEIILAAQIKPRRSNLRVNVGADAARGHMEFSEEVDMKRQQSPGRRGDVNAVERIWVILQMESLAGIINSDRDLTSINNAKISLLNLSLKHGFVTMVTTFIVRPVHEKQPILTYTMPDEPESSDDRHNNDGPKVPAIRQKKKQPEGKRSSKKESRKERRKKAKARKSKKYRPFVDNDPHFVIPVEGIPEPICFDVSGKSGDVLQLIHDPISEIVVNGLVMTTPFINPILPASHTNRTYFQEFYVSAPGFTMFISTALFTADQEYHYWNRRTRLYSRGRRITLTANKLRLALDSGVTFSIMKHARHSEGNNFEFLGFYVDDGSGLSLDTVGLIGQFHNKLIRYEREPYISEDGSIVAQLYIEQSDVQEVIHAKLRYRRNMEIKQHVPCWHVGKHGESLMDGSYKHFFISDLFNVLGGTEEEDSS